jgi:hypothetical protein
MNVLPKDFQNQSSPSAKLKFSTPTKVIDVKPLVGSHDWKANTIENRSGNTPNTANRMKNGESST